METTSTVIPYFLYSSGILLREGLEALLVIIALVARRLRGCPPGYRRQYRACMGGQSSYRR
jgi:high-affinity Fe2+/Pb2+ permease